jgi:hypothetical protein
MLKLEAQIFLSWGEIKKLAMHDDDAHEIFMAFKVVER